MKQPIHCISISRNMQAATHGMYNTTNVYFHRGNKVKSYQTNPLFETYGRISNASVIRAKRAQMALLAQAEELANMEQVAA